jgi:hypothetical protein
MRISLSLLFLLLALRVIAQEAVGGWSLVSVESLPTVIDTFRGRDAQISPDGSAMMWTNPQDGLCIYTFFDAAVVCTEPPPELELAIGPLNRPVWSPDSTQIALYESAFELNFESDIWLFDAATHRFRNVTDDGVYGEATGSVAPIDYLPRWNPADGLLYFVRSIRDDDAESPYSVELYRLPESGEPELVYDLAAIPGPLPLSLPIAFSPDGSQLAILTNPFSSPDEPGHGVWILDMATGGAREIATLTEINATMPTSVEANLFLNDLFWTNGNLVVLSLDPFGSGFGAAHYIDLASGEITPLLDMSDMDADARMEVAPIAGVVSPDGNVFWYVNATSQGDVVRIMAQTLPPEGEPVLLMETLSEEPRRTYSIPSVSADSRALLFDSLLTFQHE